ncbi:hypothetical protein Naga_100919g3 [Nannochloropsis gaditana]|uniref:Uncharacterized protein n=1 Tax=Nannochloropsis gaditana TaxID=72520 RepID=W7TZU2_9STRA|nr:hypothetical protein Naga_100919g3 [Nannochloropsis gaditana]
MALFLLLHFSELRSAVSSTIKEQSKTRDLSDTSIREPEAQPKSRETLCEEDEKQHIQAISLHSSPSSFRIEMSKRLPKCLESIKCSVSKAGDNNPFSRTTIMY